ncbi:MAG: phosphate acyltransferase, partial [Campylobacterales bacterium]|nr:phosphate acyltransferase [Campylobacterales bacterium]
MIKVAIDAMGGDFGPEPIIEGVISALDERPQSFIPILVGDKDELLLHIPEFYLSKVQFVSSSDVIEMSDSATNALKRKESSIYKAVELVRDKEADAVVS